MSCFCAIAYKIPPSVPPCEATAGDMAIALVAVGGGGTNFARCFRWLDERRIVPQTLVFLTDELRIDRLELTPSDS
jgi:hypothetical protein